MDARARTNPFPGLRPFMQEEADLFFGRDRQSDELVRRLASMRFLAAVGTSGSGKSSLVRAGLLPSLEGGFMCEAGTHWRIAILRPQNDPIGYLARALVETGALTHLDLAQSAAKGVVETTLRRSNRGLVEAARLTRLEPHENLLIVVDQFEELFRLADLARQRGAADEAPAFVKLLLEAARQTELPVYVVITMRSDFLGDCARFRDLPEAISDSQYLIPRLTRDELQAVITGPIGVRAGRIAPSLVQRLLNDVGDDMDQLPVLQHALMRAWEHWERSAPGDRPIDLDDLEAIGGLADALSRHADEAFGSLTTERDRKIAERLFKCLTEKGPDNREIRRPTPLSRIAAIANADPAEVIRVIDVFRAPGRSFLMPPHGVALEGDSVIDISHESLIRQWGRLRTWVEEEAESRATYLRLVEAARLRRSGKAGLWGEPDLTYARQWQEREAPNATWAERYGPGFDDAGTFLRDSEAAHAAKLEQESRRAEADRVAKERELEQAKALAEAQKQRADEQAAASIRQRRFSWALFVLLGFAVGTAIYAWQQKKAAENQSQLLLSRQLAAQAQIGADLNLRAPHNLLLALESISITQKIGAFSPTESRQLLTDMLNATGGIPLQHAAPVVAVGFSPDDRWLAAASGDSVQLWDMQAPSTAPVTLGGHDKVVNALAFSPDGRTLATVGGDAGVRLWDMAAADRAASARVLAAHSAHLVDVAFSRNGRWLATASTDGAAQLWDLAAADPATATSIMPHNKGVNTLAFSPDNQWLATGSSDGTVRLWDLLSPNPSTGPIPLHVNPDVRKVAFSPNSQWLVAGDRENYTVVLMRVTAPDKPFLLKVNQWVEAVAFSPDGRWLATPSQYDARLWDLNKPDPSSEPLILPGHKNRINALAFSRDGRWFATGSADHTVQLWNVANRFTAPAILRGHEGLISGLAFSSDSRRLATASADGTVRLWNISSPAAEPLALSTPDGSTELHMWDIRAVDSPAAPRIFGDKLDPGAGSQFSPDGQWIATISAGGVEFVHLWNLSTPSPAHYLVQHEGGIWASPVFSPNGRWLATGGVTDPTVRLWDLKSPNPASDPHLLQGHNRPVRSLAFSADGHRLVTGARDGFALVWDLTASPSASPKRLAGGDIKAVAISTDGRRVVTGSWEPDYAARIWDLSSPVSSSNPITLTFADRLFDVAFSPNGRWVAAGSWDSTTQLLDLTKPGTKPFVLKGHTARTLSVAFSPDSQWLATGNEDQTARLWNLAVADPSANSTVLQAAYEVGNVSFSADGRWLALNPTEYRSSPFSPDGHWFVSSSTDTRLYHLRLEDLILLACRTAGRNLTKTEWGSSFGDQPYRKTCPQLP